MPSFTHYYYDAQGRLLGAVSNSHELRTSRTDNADNPSYLHIFPVSPRGAQGVVAYGALLADQFLTSPDGRFRFIIQEDGNAVVCQGSTLLWQTGTAGHQPGWFNLDGTGNLLLFGPDDGVLWNAGITNGTATNAYLTMQSDGNLVLFENGASVWSTGTGGH